MEIFAPFAGIVRYHVKEGDEVATGETIATIESVKLEAPVPTPGPGVVTALKAQDFSNVVGGEVVAVVEATAKAGE